VQHKKFYIISGFFVFSVFASLAWVTPLRDVMSSYRVRQALFLSSKADTVVKSGRRPRLKLKDRYSNRFSEKTPTSPFVIKDPKNISTEFKLDSVGKISVYEKTKDLKGNDNYRPAERMTIQDFNNRQQDRFMKDYWKKFAASQDGKDESKGRGLLPKIELPPAIDRIFGGSKIDFKPNGNIQLDIGYISSFYDNPATPVDLRRISNLLFQQQAQINFQGKIGDKLNINTNFDTKASFNFQNQLKLNWRTNEEDILQNVEVGNTAWQLNSQLIPGIQNLFGLKTLMRFGNLDITLVAAQQRSKQDCITLRGGSQGKGFEIKSSNYDENRHFFLSQYFRDNYEKSLKNLPMITSGVTITRIEVYVTNRTQTTETLRNLVGFSDLGEGRPYNIAKVQALGGKNEKSPVDNKNNNLFNKLKADTASLRRANETTFRLESSFGLQKGTDFDLLRGAKRLTEREFRFHPELGYISLITPLRNDEVLAVSYEYTLNGQRHQVGELTEDYQGLQDNQVLFLKLLKSSTLRNTLPSTFNPNAVPHPMWNLMMKNVYSLNTQTINRQGFQFRVIYKDDQTGVDNPNLQEGKNIKDIPLLRVMGLDKLNSNNDPQVDGNFDFVEGVTVDSKNGKIIFPVLEPFGSSLSKQFTVDESSLIDKYVFDKLYSLSQSDAIQLTGKDKFFLKGSVQSGVGGDVSLPFGVDAKSVQVTSGGVPLAAGTDYIVEPQSGKVRILSGGVSNSGREIRVCYEKPDLFNNQIRTMLGTHIDYTVGQNLHLGGTIQHMGESPPGYLRRVQMGNEPVSNTIFGFDAAIQQKSNFLTRMIDALPLISTKETSAFDFTGEYAQLIPAVNNDVQNNAFIDDFEAARNIFSLNSQPTAWKPGATPLNFEQGSPRSFVKNYKRAKISAYVADFSLFRGDGGSLDNLGINTTESQRYVYERTVSVQSLFPNKTNTGISGVTNIPISILDISYFPEERGIYNFNTDLTSEGLLKNPTQNFGAITRAITSDTDFDNANIETLEFWMMDPLVSGEAGIVRATGDPTKDAANSLKRISKGGKLVFNLGDVSEDFVPDGFSNFENGIPGGEKIEGGSKQNVERTIWGIAPTQQFVINAFSTGTNANDNRTAQDVGLDGMPNASSTNNEVFNETNIFRDYLDKIGAVVKGTAINQFRKDPAGDDFTHYLNEKYNGSSSLILRYKDYMGLENNSPTTNSTTANTNSGFTEANNQQPDREDLNQDNTINDTEAYFEYEIDVQATKMNVGQNYIVDKIVENGVNWYLFRIPLRTPTKAYGGINGLKNIRFIRTYLTGWEAPVVCRFAAFQLTGFQYRKYIGDLTPRGLQNVPEPYDAKLKVSAVNIEENGSLQGGDNKGGQSVAYVVPPGFERDRDVTTINNAELNEQSMSLCVEGLRDGDSRAAFKNTLLDFINYKNLQMFISMNSADESANEQVKAFIRFGTDLTENYYEIETPGLKRTPYGTNNSAEQVWIPENNIDIPFEALKSVKLARDRDGKSKITEPFVRQVGKYTVTVVGRPDLSTVLTTMIGVRNPLKTDKTPDDNGQDKTFCVWVNELRANGFEQTSGQAAIGKLNLKLADFANVTVNGSFKNYGFGGVQSKISERARENTLEYGIAANINVDKLLPEKWGVKIPLYVTYDRKNISPRFNPLDPDVPLDSSLANIKDAGEREQYRQSAEDNTERKGINLTNVRKVKTGQNTVSHPWDVENFTLTYAFSELTRRNTLIDEYRQTQYKGGIAYSFTGNPKPIEPFKKIKSDHPLMRWIKDFNFTPLPNSVTLRADMDRSFIKTQLRNVDPTQTAGTGTPKLTSKGIDPLYEKYWLFNRAYNLNWNFTKSVVIAYSASANAIIDEPYGGLESQSERDSVAGNLRRFGRTKGFDQNVNIVWRLPLNKSPLTDWMSADYSHRFGYNYVTNSFEIKDEDGYLFGNIIKNTRNRSINGKIDLVALYNRVRALRLANQPRVSRKNVARNPGDDEDIIKPQPDFMRSVTRLLMAIRGIQVNYNIDEATTLAGFLPTPGILGLNSVNSSPGIGFITGSQDADIRFRAAENGWITKSKLTNVPFVQTRTQNLTYRTAIEPFRDFKIQLEGKWSRGDNYQEIFRATGENGKFESQSPVRSGNYSMSFLSFLTAFDSNSPDDNSEIFNRFRSYREIILKRLNAEKGSIGEYNKNSQDVLIPAFFAAYSGVSPDKVSFSPFMNIPLPNWRLDYNGLANVGWFKRKFTNISIQHAYSSTYSVGNFISSLEYSDPYQLNLNNLMYPLSSKVNEDGSLIPVYVMSSITFQEKFSPLISFDATTKNRISIRVAYSQDRNIGLTPANNYVNELSNKDLSIKVGFNGLSSLSSKGRSRAEANRQGEIVAGAIGEPTRPQKTIPLGRKILNEMKFEATLTLRDTRTIQRKLDSAPVVSQGFSQFIFRQTAAYEVNKKLIVTAFFDKNFTSPYISSSFYRSEDRVGVTVSFKLSE
jgi:cell surface protein SprA